MELEIQYYGIGVVVVVDDMYSLANNLLSLISRLQFMDFETMNLLYHSRKHAADFTVLSFLPLTANQY